MYKIASVEMIPKFCIGFYPLKINSSVLRFCNEKPMNSNTVLIVLLKITKL